MDQLTIGDELRDQGIAQALAATHAGVVRMVDDAIRVAAHRYPRFTADHVRQICELDWGIAHVDIGRIIGGQINGACRRGDIVATGMTVKSSRPDSRSRRLLVWERAR